MNCFLCHQKSFFFAFVFINDCSFFTELKVVKLQNKTRTDFFIFVCVEIQNEMNIFLRSASAYMTFRSMSRWQTIDKRLAYYEKNFTFFFLFRNENAKQIDWFKDRKIDYIFSRLTFLFHFFFLHLPVSSSDN